MNTRFFLSFIEEGIMNPTYKDYIGGRVEIFDENSESSWAMDERRFFTKKIREFEIFRNKWDMDTVNKDTLDMFKRVLEAQFNETIE